ncbi:MAG: hypothetical protein NTV07_02250, partial [Candidatus Omnitrophica bacterium]|nr:hypothetical protein [Candidatus Omnitrophota bacterium]
TVVGGAIYINESNGVTLGADGTNTYGLTSTTGPIYITAANTGDGTLIAGAVTVATDNANGITLVTNEGAGGLNDIQLGLVTAGTTSAVVTLVSDNDITDNDAAVDIIAYGLLLEAGGSVGSTSDYVDTTVTTIDDRSASANVHNNIYINETNAVTLGAVNGLTTDIGDIKIIGAATAAGDMTATNVTAGDDGDIYLTTTTAGSNISVGLITALDDDVYLNAAASITDADTTAVDIVAGGLYLQTGTGSVGASGNYLDTKVATIDDYATNTNVATDIYINEYDGVNLGSLTATSGLSTDAGNIYVTSNATDDGTLTATLVTAGGSGDIYLKSQIGQAATGDINDIAVGLITAANDDIYLESDDDIIDLNPDAVIDVVSSGLYLSSVNGTVGGNGSNLELDTQVDTIDDLSATKNVSEGIYIIEYDGVNLGSITSTGLTTDTGDIDITAANGAAGTLTATLVTAGGAGNILLTTLDGGSATNNIAVGLVTASGDDVSLVADGAITDGDAAVDIVASALYLQSGTSVGALLDYLDTQVSTIDDYTGGTVGTDLYINEYDGATLGSLNTTTGLSTTNGEIRIIGAATAAGDLTAKVLTAGGTGKNIYLTTTNSGGSSTSSIGLGLVTATGDDVILDSNYNITDSDLDLTVDVAADGLYLDALGSVGGSTAAARIETTVSTIDDRTVTDNVTGDIYIGETDAVTLGGINGLTTDAGLIDITAGGTISVGTIAANGGHGVTLNATGGDILDAGGGSITSTADAVLKANGVIGTINNPIAVNINGHLSVWSNSLQDEVSVNLKGTINADYHTQRSDLLESASPGLVILNNQLMGGGNYGSGSIKGSIMSYGFGYIDIVRNDVNAAFYEADLQPWGHKLMQYWILKEGARIDDRFLSALPAVIDVSQLNLPALQADLANTANYYMIRSLK